MLRIEKLKFSRHVMMFERTTFQSWKMRDKDKDKDEDKIVESET